MPEQELLSIVPGQPPLSRWIAQIEIIGSRWAIANLMHLPGVAEVGHLGLLRVVVDAGQQRYALHGPEPPLAARPTSIRAGSQGRLPARSRAPRSVAASAPARNPTFYRVLSPRRDHPTGLPAGSEAGFITGEQLTRATGIA